MAVDEDCRQVVYAGAAAAVAAPLFRAIPPAAKVHNGFAPAITIMDHRGCSRGFGEYKGGSSGHQDDDMFAAKQLAEPLSLKAVQKLRALTDHTPRTLVLSRTRPAK